MSERSSFEILTNVLLLVLLENQHYKYCLDEPHEMLQEMQCREVCSKTNNIDMALKCYSFSDSLHHIDLPRELVPTSTINTGSEFNSICLDNNTLSPYRSMASATVLSANGCDLQQRVCEFIGPREGSLVLCEKCRDPIAKKSRSNLR